MNIAHEETASESRDKTSFIAPGWFSGRGQPERMSSFLWGGCWIWNWRS